MGLGKTSAPRVESGEGTEGKQERPYSSPRCPVIEQEATDIRYEKFHLNVRKSFYCESDLTLAQIAQRNCGVFILGDIKNPNRSGSEQSVLADPALGIGVRLDDLQSCLAISAFLWFCEIRKELRHFFTVIPIPIPEPFYFMSSLNLLIVCIFQHRI